MKQTTTIGIIIATVAIVAVSTLLLLPSGILPSLYTTYTVDRYHTGIEDGTIIDGQTIWISGDVVSNEIWWSYYFESGTITFEEFEEQNQSALPVGGGLTYLITLKGEETWNTGLTYHTTGGAAPDSYTSEEIHISSLTSVNDDDTVKLKTEVHIALDYVMSVQDWEYLEVVPT